jgi:hypothetical protein
MTQITYEVKQTLIKLSLHTYSPDGVSAHSKNSGEISVLTDQFSIDRSYKLSSLYAFLAYYEPARPAIIVTRAIRISVLPAASSPIALDSPIVLEYLPYQQPLLLPALSPSMVGEKPLPIGAASHSPQMLAPLAIVPARRYHCPIHQHSNFPR